MKIGSNLETPAVGDTAPRGNARLAAAPAATTVAAGDQVALSAAGTQMAAGTGGDFDSGKVDTIRQAIRDGRFTVNAGAIADRLIADAAALLAPRTSA